MHIPEKVSMSTAALVVAVITAATLSTVAAAKNWNSDEQFRQCVSHGWNTAQCSEKAYGHP
jgi:hypothetical protein